MTYWYHADGSCPTKPANSKDPADRLRRPPGSRPPCETCPKIAAGDVPAPHNGVRLSDENRRAWDHYRECRAVNWQVPEATDPLVRRHAALLRAVEEAAEKRDAAAALAGLMARVAGAADNG